MPAEALLLTVTATTTDNYIIFGGSNEAREAIINCPHNSSCIFNVISVIAHVHDYSNYI